MNIKQIKLVAIAVMLIAWLATPQQVLIIFLLERVFTITNLIIGVLVLLAYIIIRLKQQRLQQLTQNQFKYRQFTEPDIADAFKERIKK